MEVSDEYYDKEIQVDTQKLLQNEPLVLVLMGANRYDEIAMCFFSLINPTA